MLSERPNVNIPDIDFTRIRSVGPSGQRGGFEQFICEQVAQESPEPGAKFVSLHGDGGDGGVECYWTLPNGAEHGYQAKYWTHHGDVDKGQLDRSVKAAVEQHPNLKKYTISIPADPTGPTGGRGKSLLEKLSDPGGWLEGWQKLATDRGMDVEFELEWETNIVDRLNSTESTPPVPSVGTGSTPTSSPTSGGRTGIRRQKLQRVPGTCRS